MEMGYINVNLLCLSVNRFVYFPNYKSNVNFKTSDIIMLNKNLISVTGNMTYRHVKLISVKMKDKAALYRTEQGLVEANLGDLKNQFSLKQKELYHQ